MRALLVIFIFLLSCPFGLIHAVSENNTLNVKLIQEPKLPITEIVSIFGVGATISGLIYTIYRGTQEAKRGRQAQEENTKLKFAEMLSNFEKDLQKIMDEERKLNDNAPDEDCHRIASDFLNILDRIAYLRNLGKIDDEMIDYFNWFFGVGLRYIWWKDEMDKMTTSNEKWPHQWWWDTLERNKDKIKMGDVNDLGDALQNALKRHYGTSVLKEKTMQEKPNTTRNSKMPI